MAAVGAVERATVGWFDRAARDYRRIPVDEQCELLSLIGDVAEGQDGPILHVHAVLGLSDRRGIPEHMIAADPGFWVREQTAQLIGAGANIEPEEVDDYIRCFRDQQAIAAICADFRASPGPDLAHDDKSIAAGQKVKCPLLVLWGTQGKAGSGYDPPAIWQPYAPDVRGVALPTGHFVPEEAPGLVVDALRGFLN